MKKMVSPVSIRSVGPGKHSSINYATINLYFPGNECCTAAVHWEVHVVDGLKAKMLIGIDILGSKSFTINTGNKKATIRSCNNIIILLEVAPRAQMQFTQQILANRDTTIPAKILGQIPVQSKLLKGTNLTQHHSLCTNCQLRDDRYPDAEQYRQRTHNCRQNLARTSCQVQNRRVLPSAHWHSWRSTTQQTLQHALGSYGFQQHCGEHLDRIKQDSPWQWNHLLWRPQYHGQISTSCQAIWTKPMDWHCNNSGPSRKSMDGHPTDCQLEGEIQSR